MVQKLMLVTGLFVFMFLSRSVLGDISILMNIQSAAIVLGGALISVFLSFPLKTFKDLMRSLAKVFRQPPADLEELIRQAKILARIRRLYGPRELTAAAAKIENPFLRKGIDLVLDEYDRFEIHAIMEREYEIYLSRKEAQVSILNTLARLSPAFGFVGTIIGLISVLNHMGNPGQIGSGMALALLTTFYGLLLANFLFQPLARKLSARFHEQAIQHSIVLEAVLDIADAKNPLAISHRLNSYVNFDEQPEKMRVATDRRPNLKPLLKKIAAGK